MPRFLNKLEDVDEKLYYMEDFYKERMEYMANVMIQDPCKF